MKLAGRAVTRLVDTGGINVITPELARELGLTVRGEIEGRGVGEKKVDVGVTEIARVEIGDAFLENQTFYVLPLDPLSAVEGRSASGLIGYEIFRRFVARIDYDAQRLSLHDPSRSTYQGDGVAVPIAFDDHTPRIEAELDGLRGWFDLDTGSLSSLTLATPFVEARGLRARYAPRFTGTAGWGVGGATPARLARAKRFRIAGIEVREPVSLVSLQRAGAFAASDIAGNIGGGILKRFDLTRDYEHERIFFEPNTKFAERDVFDRSGVCLNDTGDALEVMDVTPGGLAERAGLRTGEKLRTIDGKPLAVGDLLPRRARFQREEPGTAQKLEVEAETGVRAK